MTNAGNSLPPEGQPEPWNPFPAAAAPGSAATPGSAPAPAAGPAPFPGPADNPYAQQQYYPPQGTATQQHYPGNMLPVRRPIGGLGITGMVLASLIWIPYLVFAPYVYVVCWFLGGEVTGFGIPLLGVAALLGGITGFVLSYRRGNGPQAARWFVIPSLVWQSLLPLAFVAIWLTLNT